MLDTPIIPILQCWIDKPRTGLPAASPSTRVPSGKEAA